MSRKYEFVFRRLTGNGEFITTCGIGNTKATAERSARRKLRDDHKKDPSQFLRIGVRFLAST